MVLLTSVRFRMVIDPRLWHGSRSPPMEEGSGRAPVDCR